MFSAVRTMALAGALAVAFVGGAQAHSITYTVAAFSENFNGGSLVSGGSTLNLFGTLFGSRTSNLTPGVSLEVALDDVNGTGVDNSTSTIMGTAASNVTINGITLSVADNFAFDTATGSVSFSGGAPVVFDLGTFDVTVTPIASTTVRAANFLETAIAAPEPTSLTLLALGLAGFGLVLRTRRV